MLTIAVCDDEKMIVNQMEEIILKTSIKYKIPVETEGFYSGESLKTEILKGKKYDLIYLEIQLKGENGIALAQKIREVDENVLFIYVSDYEKIMRELFRLRVFDFINKPVNKNHFIQSRTKSNVVLANGVKLPVSEKKQKRFAKEYETLLEEIIE